MCAALGILFFTHAMPATRSPATITEKYRRFMKGLEGVYSSKSTSVTITEKY
jgi:hypothetical protein